MGYRGPRVDSVCAFCSKPVRSGTLTLLQPEGVVHVWCRTRRLEAQAMEESARARMAKARSSEVMNHATVTMVESRRLRAVIGPCPLCGESSSWCDWRPGCGWVVVEGCPCQGFFVDGRILDARLPRLAAGDLGALVRTVRRLRRVGHEAWCTTGDGTVEGPLVVRTERPARP